MTEKARTAAADRVLSERYLERFPEAAASILEGLDDATLLEVLGGQTDSVLYGVLDKLSHARAAAVLQELPRAAGFLESRDPSRAARVLATMEEEPRERLLEAVPQALAREVRELIAYPAEVAGAVMDARFLALRPEARVGDAVAALRAAAQRPREQVFLIDGDGVLKGRVLLAELAIARAEDRLREHLVPCPAVITAMTPRDEVTELIGTHRLTSLPVTDAEGRLVGVIRQEALLDASRAQALGDLQTMVGASREERALSKASFAVRKRMPWLQVNLLTAFLAAAVVGLFEDTIARVTALAVLLPVVAGQSGNTGAQALAVTMRGLALREVRVRQWPRVLRKEVTVGFVNGLAVAATTSLAVFFWSRSTGLALVIGLSMVLSMTIAGLAGGAVPLVLTALRQDPAQSSSIVLTTVTDVAGFFSFLGIATLLSSQL